MTLHKLLLLPSCLFILSCTSNNGENLTTQIANDQSTATGTFNIALKGEDASFATKSQLVYRLYGYDPYLADVSATLVYERVVSLDSLPTTAFLEWPENAVSLIRPPVSSIENAEFYLNLQVDLDLDGQLCNGDLVQDYSQTDFFTLQSMPTETIAYYLKKIDKSNGDCEGY